MTLLAEMQDPGLIVSETITHPMHSKFTISYTIFPEHNKRVETHHTDDPVEAETFLVQLLTSGTRIHSIMHDGVPVEPHQFDRLLKVAATRVAAELISRSLHMDYAEVKHRFGFAS
jgi:hypothetical protein